MSHEKDSCWGLDIFKTSASYNMVVGATSGAGKSFWVAYIINNYLGAGPRSNNLIHYRDTFEGFKKTILMMHLTLMEPRFS
nr:hypothetical protein [Escherichia coli]